jgi:hypothetical protein
MVWNSPPNKFGDADVVTPIASDTMLGLMKTCKKLGLSFYQYIGDRLGIDGHVIPPLAGLVAAKA